MSIWKVPILASSGQTAGAFGPEVGLGVRTAALTVGGVGVDRQPRGQGDGRRFEL